MPSPTVLIIEDVLPIRILLTAVVERHGLTPVCAATGAAGLELLEREEFAAVLLDLLLPDVSGSEVLRRVASTRPEMLLRTIVLTGAHDSIWSDCKYVRRARAVMRKPFEMADLERELLACCEGFVS